MPDVSTLVLFAAACVVLSATPGPDMLLIASRSVSQGRAAGFLTYAGIATGTYCHAFAAAFGLSQVILAYPGAYDGVRWIGAGYLLYLAWKTIRSAGADVSPQPRLAPYPMKQIFLEGLLTNLLNPKVILFVLALFPQFLQPDAGSLFLQVFVLATILNSIAFVVNGSVIMLGSHMNSVLKGRWASSRLPHYMLAGVFAGLAFRLAVGSRS